MKLEFEKHPLSKNLSSLDREFIVQLSEKHQFSFQQLRQLVQVAIELNQWDAPSLSYYWSEHSNPNFKDKKATQWALNNLFEKIDQLRREPTDYTNFRPTYLKKDKDIIVESFDYGTLLGSCPCPTDSIQTRCCNLLTLDVVRQCGFGCSYCSIQSFYYNNQITFASNIKERLLNLELPESSWHIGTGQSSDSLLWGNKYGVLDVLREFALKHPKLVIELKTKSSRVDWIDKLKGLKNIVATWSLNAPTIIEKEEHGTSSLTKRLEAARVAADNGIAVGFHLHPMLYFKDGDREYKEVIDRVTTLFSPKEVVMFSFGTLTFTKEVIKQLRSSKNKTKILQMEFFEVAKKYSYSDDIKINLFKNAYNSFPKEWKSSEAPFYYLCMEKPDLWEPVFGYSYDSNDAFEAAMKESYYSSLNL